MILFERWSHNHVRANRLKNSLLNLLIQIWKWSGWILSRFIHSLFAVPTWQCLRGLATCFTQFIKIFQWIAISFDLSSLERCWHAICWKHIFVCYDVRAPDELKSWFSFLFVFCTRLLKQLSKVIANKIGSSFNVSFANLSNICF